VELKDGTRQAGEIYAGAGYYSQSDAACFFGYKEGNPPTNIMVRWPSGKTSNHPVSLQTTTLTLTAP